LVQFSAQMRAQSTELKSFLFSQLYRHPQVTETMDRAKQVVRDLFAAYVADPKAMQTGFAMRMETVRASDERNFGEPQRIVADYIAGMTDRFAAREHMRLTGQNLLA
jgi:dGTPase